MTNTKNLALLAGAFVVLIGAGPFNNNGSRPMGANELLGGGPSRVEGSWAEMSGAELSRSETLQAPSGPTIGRPRRTASIDPLLPSTSPMRSLPGSRTLRPGNTPVLIAPPRHRPVQNPAAAHAARHQQRMMMGLASQQARSSRGPALPKRQPKYRPRVLDSRGATFTPTSRGPLAPERQVTRRSTFRPRSLDSHSGRPRRVHRPQAPTSCDRSSSSCRE